MRRLCGRTSFGRPTSPTSKVIGWGWFYLSTILDDYSRYVVAWRLCTTMKADDVTETLEDALVASGCDQRHGCCTSPACSVDNGSSYISGDLARWLDEQGMDHVRGSAQTTRRHRARSSDGTRP